MIWARIMFRLTGGRPMRKDGFAFKDAVSGKAIYYWTDNFGRKWMAENRWSIFRVRANGVRT